MSESLVVEVKEEKEKIECIKKTDECRQIYKDYKNICSQQKKCKIKDFEKISIDELNKYINELIKKHNSYKKCYFLRTQYKDRCVEKNCWDEGHEYVILQAKTVYMGCKDILIKILIFIDNLKIDIDKQLSDSYLSLSKFYEQKEKSLLPKKLEELNKKYEELNDKLEEVDNVDEKLIEVNKKLEDLIILKNKVSELQRHPPENPVKNFKKELNDHAIKIFDAIQSASEEKRNLLLKTKNDDIKRNKSLEKMTENINKQRSDIKSLIDSEGIKEEVKIDKQDEINIEIEKIKKKQQFVIKLQNKIKKFNF